MALRNLPPRLTTVDVKTVQCAPKKADAYYASAEWRDLRLVVLRRDRFQCVLCGDRATIVDHVKARRFGGADEPGNCRSLCRTCDNKVKEGPTGVRKSGSVPPI